MLFQTKIIRPKSEEIRLLALSEDLAQKKHLASTHNLGSGAVSGKINARLGTIKINTQMGCLFTPAVK
jgi:hypothetical protein